MQLVQQVLVAYDRSAMAEEALKRGISVAKKKDAQLMVVHVIEPPFMESPYFASVDEDAIKKELITKIDELNRDAGVEYMLFIEHGEPAEAIKLQVEKTQSDLIVVGSHGKGDIDSDHIGTTVLKLLQDSHIPVLIVKNSTFQVYQKMIEPTNLSDCSKKSILFANRLFIKPSRKYLYAADTISELQAMTYRISEIQRQDLRKKMAFSAKSALKVFVNEVGGGEMALIDFKASVNEDLLAYIVEDDADLLVLGSDCMNSFLLSSTASYLLQRSPMDVLVYVQ